MDLEDCYDFIIVGGGTAGLVLARRLSDKPDISVLVIEAGEDHSDDPRVTTPGFWPTLLNTPMDWAFKTISQGNLGGRSGSFPQGRMLGGTSALNGMMLTGPSKHNIDGWEELGNPGWAWATFQKYLGGSFNLSTPSEQATERLDLKYLTEDKAHQQHNGPVQCSFPEDPEDIWTPLWIKTLQDMGFHRNGDPFAGELCGVFTNAESIDMTTRQRSYSLNAYIKPVQSRKDLTVLTSAVVRRIRFQVSGGKTVASGVEYVHEGEEKYMRASKDILLTAGCFNTPKLLEASGVGDCNLLNKLGIEIVIDNRNVGENLQNHLMCAVNFQVRDDLPTKDALVRQDSDTLAAAAQAYQSLSGPFASAGTIASAQVPLPEARSPEGRSKLEALFKDIQSKMSPPSEAEGTFAKLHEQYVRSVTLSPTEASALYISVPLDTGARDPTAANSAAAQAATGKENYFTINVILGHPLSRGSVHLTAPADGSTDFGLAINPNYLSNPLDIEILARHMQFVEAIAAAEPLASHLKVEGNRSVRGLSNLDKAKEYIRNTATGAHHATSTCSMMPREMGGVVDPRLRVYGCENLRVCDASIIPLTPRTNPQATVYGVAEMAAAIIKADHKI